MSREILEKGQASNLDVSLMLERKKTGIKPTWKEVSQCGADSKAYWGQWESLQVPHGLLSREKRRDGEERRETDQKDAHERRIRVHAVMPQTLRKEVLCVMQHAVIADTWEPGGP